VAKIPICLGLSVGLGKATHVIRSIVVDSALFASMDSSSGWFGITWFVLAGGPLTLSLVVKPRHTLVLLSDLRIPRILYYWLIACLGFALGLEKLPPEVEIGSLLDRGILPMGAMFINLAYAAVFAIATNDREDKEIDRISNPSRPLVSNRISESYHWSAGLFCLCHSILLAALGGWPFLICVLGISVGYFLYSSKPFKLKRIPILAKMVLGLNSWLAAVSGFMIAGSNPADFPIQWTLFILVPMGLAANFIDLKDYDGDKAAGIRTLPVWLGPGNARHFIAFATVVTYLMANFLLDCPWSWIPAVPFCGFHVFSLYRLPYREGPVFFSVLTNLGGLVLFLLLGGLLP